jgi:zinc-ribbon domain
MAQDLSSVARSATQDARSAKEEPFLQPWQFFLLGGMLAATATVIVATGQAPANIIILSLTVVSVSFVGLGAYRILSPLVTEPTEQPITFGGRTRIALEREKMLVMRSIKELEFDFAMGKMSQADFDEMSGRLRSRALGLMRQLDAGGGYRDQIEVEVKRRLESDGFSRGSNDADSANDADVATAKAVALQTSCSECDTQNDPDARFCKNCGAKL